MTKDEISMLGKPRHRAIDHEILKLNMEMDKLSSDNKRLKVAIELAMNSLADFADDVVHYDNHTTMWEHLADAINYAGDAVQLPLDDDPLHYWKQKASKVEMIRAAAKTNKVVSSEFILEVLGDD